MSGKIYDINGNKIMVMNDSGNSITGKYRFFNKKNNGINIEDEDENNYDSNNLSDIQKNDLHKIIDILLDIEKNGLWSEKCEASKALLFIYTEFHDDLKISSSKFLENQLNLFNDDNWQVK